MAEDLNFVDLVALSRIKPDTVVEKFGGMINSSFFDASNILGSLKQKGLIDFTTSFPGQSAITVTDQGKQVLQESEERAKSDFDMLDLTIITQLSGGKRGLPDLGSAVNVRQRDLAMHLFKLASQQYISYDIRNGNIDIALTEKGFLQVKSGMPKPKQPQVQQAAQAQAAQQAQNPAAQEGSQATQPAAAAAQVGEAPYANAGQEQGTQMSEEGGAVGIGAGATAAPSTDLQKLESDMIKAKRRSMYMIIGVALVIIIFVIALILIELKFV
ncbi:MAG: hypothetical protein QXW10_02665 [Candidatus Micrarchaeaceae archaeon]